MPEPINRIKVVLTVKNRKGKWLAEKLGVNKMTVSAWCTNKMQPHLSTLVKIAKLLKVDVKDLLNSTL